MKGVLIDVSRNDATGEHRLWPDQYAHYQEDPEHFYLCSGFNGYGIDEPDFVEKTIAQLEKEIGQGAKMVKVWKNFGMVDQDSKGQFIQIDDPRLQPIWDFLIENHIPVIAHIAEPVQAWRALMMGNPHYNYYKNNPQYHAFQHPEIPFYETIIAARDQWMANNPNLTIIGAHMGSMSHDVDMIAARLDKFPNFYVEPAARFGDLAQQESGKVREFFVKYQDRILYGTDLGSGPAPENATEEDFQMEKNRLQHFLQKHWDYFSGTDTMYYNTGMMSFPFYTKGLGLPDTVLQKLYHDNAATLLQL